MATVRVKQPTTVTRMDGTVVPYVPTPATNSDDHPYNNRLTNPTAYQEYLRLGGAPNTGGAIPAGYTGGTAQPATPVVPDTPKLPSYTPGQFNPSTSGAMSYEEALRRAESQLASGYTEARTGIGSTAQQQQELLRQRLSAKGQLRGGAIERGSEEISAGLLSSLSSLNSDQLSQVASLAQQLYNTDQDRTMQERNQQFSEYATGENLRLQAAGMDAGNYWNTVGQGNIDRNFEAGRTDADRSYQYQVSRDQILDDRYMAGLTYQQAQDAINNALQERQITSAEANAAASRALQREQMTYGREQDAAQLTYQQGQDAAAQARSDQATDTELRGMALQLAQKALGDYADAAELQAVALQYYQYLKGGALPTVDSGLGDDANMWLNPGQ